MNAPRATVGTDGTVAFTAPTWSRLAAYVQKKILEDRVRGHGYWAEGAAFVHAAAKAAAILDALEDDPRPVPLSEPHNGEPGIMYVSAKEAARRRGCSPELIRRMCRAGTLTARRVGRSWLIDPADLPE